MNAVLTENYWLIYAATGIKIVTSSCGVLFSDRVNLKNCTPIPCPVDRDNTVPLILVQMRVSMLVEAVLPALLMMSLKAKKFVGFSSLYS